MYVVLSKVLWAISKVEICKTNAREAYVGASSEKDCLGNGWCRIYRESSCRSAVGGWAFGAGDR